MIDFYSKPRYDFDDLCKLVEALRAPDGCPWDSVQTHESIRRNFLEEVYEACEAIDRNDSVSLCEELGDVLLHVVFHSSIEADAGRFSIRDVCNSVVEKMISRHPALFGGEEGLDWDEIKRREKGQSSLAEELDGIARSLPALWRADKMQKKAEKSHGNTSSALEDRLTAQVSALSRSDDKRAAVGALLFVAVAAARYYGVDPEMALHHYCDTFIQENRSNSTDEQLETANQA